MPLHKDYSGAELHVPGRVAGSDPGAVGAGQAWFDSTGGTGEWLMKIRNAADDGWEEAGREAIPTIPHYSKGSGDLSMTCAPIEVYATGAEDLWSIDISVYDLAVALQGGAATPDLVFDIKLATGDYTYTPSANPHDMFVTLTPNEAGQNEVWIQVSDNTTFAQVEIMAVVIVGGLTSGGGA